MSTSTMEQLILSPNQRNGKGSVRDCGRPKFNCNKKVIGARSYSIYGTSFSVRDIQGHGTHVASVAAENEVKHASFFDLAQGTARGGVPSARIAAYKVCELECNEVSILTAFDDAIADSVES